MGRKKKHHLDDASFLAEHHAKIQCIKKQIQKND
jgi:hypothetical protein